MILRVLRVTCELAPGAFERVSDLFTVSYLGPARARVNSQELVPLPFGSSA